MPGPLPLRSSEDLRLLRIGSGNTWRRQRFPFTWEQGQAREGRIARGPNHQVRGGGGRRTTPGNEGGVRRVRGRRRALTPGSKPFVNTSPRVVWDSSRVEEGSRPGPVTCPSFGLFLRLPTPVWPIRSGGGSNLQPPLLSDNVTSADTHTVNYTKKKN